MNFLALSLLYCPTFTSVPDRKNHNFDYTDIVRKGTSLLFNMLSKFVIAFLARSKCLLISWLQSLPEMIVEPKKIKMIKNFQTLSKNMDKNSRFNKGPEAKRSHLSTGWAEQ